MPLRPSAFGAESDDRSFKTNNSACRRAKIYARLLERHGAVHYF